MSFFEKLFGSFSDKELKRINPLKDKVLALEPEMAKLTDDELKAKTTDFMTAESYDMPWDVLGTVTSRIVNEVKHVNRVFYDCTGKPPATIELE